MKNAIFSQVSSNLYTRESNGFQVVPNARKRLSEATDHVTKRSRTLGTNPGFINLPINGKKSMLFQEHESPRTRREEVPKEKRSQKLSDKITALQKLVSPFGKTDTASVLLEASISIKSLQHQIKDLLQSCDSDQSRGLCLVPVSLLDKLTHHNHINPPDYTLGTHIYEH